MGGSSLPTSVNNGFCLFGMSTSDSISTIIAAVSLIAVLVAIIGLIYSVCNNAILQKENQRLNKIQLQNKFPFMALAKLHVDDELEANLLPKETFMIKIIGEGAPYYLISLDCTQKNSVKKIEHCANFWFELQNSSDSIIKEVIVEKIAYQKPKSIEDDTFYSIGIVENVQNYHTINSILFTDDKIRMHVCHCFNDKSLLQYYSLEKLCISLLLKITIISGVSFYENIRFEGYSGTRSSSLSYLYSDKKLKIDYLKENSLCSEIE